MSSTRCLTNKLHSAEMRVAGGVLVLCWLCVTEVSSSWNDNMIYFHGATNVQYNVTNTSITDGEPAPEITNWIGPHGATDGLDFFAHRKGSAKPAAFFAHRLMPLQTMGLKSKYSTDPDIMNFAAVGDLSFNINGTDFQCKEFHIGQGHEGIENNWWAGSTDCVSEPSLKRMTCACGQPSHPVEFSNGANDHTFAVAIAGTSW